MAIAGNERFRYLNRTYPELVTTGIMVGEHQEKWYDLDFQEHWTRLPLDLVVPFLRLANSYYAAIGLESPPEFHELTRPATSNSYTEYLNQAVLSWQNREVVVYKAGWNPKRHLQLRTHENEPVAVLPLVEETGRYERVLVPHSVPLRYEGERKIVKPSSLLRAAVLCDLLVPYLTSGEVPSAMVNWTPFDRQEYRYLPSTRA